MSTEPQFPDAEATVQEFKAWKRTGKLPLRLRKLRVPAVAPRPAMTRDRVLEILRHNTNQE